MFNVQMHTKQMIITGAEQHSKATTTTTTLHGRQCGVFTVQSPDAGKKVMPVNTRWPSLLDRVVNCTQF